MYAEIILPLPLQGTFTYRIPEGKIEEVKIGSRVLVSFGPKKILTGIVRSVHDRSPAFKAKPIIELLDEAAILNEFQLRFFDWVAEYYMCSLGEVINAALPAALKLLSESFISLNQGIELDNLPNLSDHEFEIIETLRTTSELSIKDTAEITGLKQPQRIIKSLSEKGYIDLFEKLNDKFIPKKIRKIRISEPLLGEGQLSFILNQLASNTKQQDVLIAYLRLLPILEKPSLNKKGIEKKKLEAEDVSASSIKTLVKNGILEEWEEVVPRLPAASNNKNHEFELSPAQSNAYKEIRSQFNDKDVVLLHGITGSGKTEIYIELIKEEIAKGKQVLYLLPEIALTTQIISRLHKVFGSNFGVYHSKYSDNERVEIWNNVLNQTYQLVVGVRSAVFLPFHDLGMVIVDEEHEPSYKQYEPAPRYHARDAAIYLSTLHHSKVLLGTATPSLESYQNTLEKKYGLVLLKERFGGSYIPSIQFADIRKQKKQKKLKGNLSHELFEGIEASLKKKEQVIIFQNRRGYASHVNCENCGHIPKCPNCSVSLTYHQYNHKLVCHYCGYHQTMYADCVKCGHKELRNVGFGTEELEEELKILFPGAIVQRMDLDTTRSKFGYQRIIESFELGEIDILVGTQMISKGLDFDRVNLVGILDTDRLVHFPDFRSHERAFQLITQVSGRAGRKSHDGKVVIQTSDPGHPIFSHITENNYSLFFKFEISEREHFGFPPIKRLIKIIFRHPDKEVAYQGSLFYTNEIRKTLGNQPVNGPIEPLIAKIRNKYQYEVFVRIEKKGTNLRAIKNYLWGVEKMLLNMGEFKTVGVVFDVDPV